ncbi:T9SS type A sorting domain-containing protein [Polaribacter sp.]|jgi:hypothetical protein|uniref:T9SS type A sorting domain-containing protein n=1 Tax=Polaribacter sp. TaxID=1920175 RepID=UPI004047D6E8
MKKLYFLFTLLGSLLSFSQGSINFDDATKWTQGSATFSSYSNPSYVDGAFSLACTDVIRNGISVQDGFVGGFGTYSLRLQNDATTDVTMTITSGGVGNFTFKARRWDASPATNFTVEYSTDGGTNWTTSSTINASVTSDSDWKNINGIVNSSNANVKIRIKSNGTTERIMVDDFTWTAPTTDPTLVISSPSNGSIYSPITTSANIYLSISNFVVGNPGSGIDGHIHYTVNGDMQPMKYDTAPIALTGLTPGNYTVYVELVNNSDTPITPAVNATVTFTIAAYNVVADLAALRADVVANGTGKYYQISSNPVITYARTTRNQKYIQDSGAGILIDDVPGTISTTMVVGDAISGLKGQTSLFNGVLQLLPVENPTVTSSGNIITPEVVTAADITANIEMFESKLVQINNASFSSADGTVVFATNKNYDLNDGSTIVFRTMFEEADYIGQVIPSGAANRVFLVAEYNGAAQVVARSLADVTLSVDSFNSINGFATYPNPVTNNSFTITSNSAEKKGVDIFNVLGKKVLSTTFLGTKFDINVASISSGIYILKVSEGSKTSTSKLVIQ